ncbi:aspartate transaminase [Maritalea myrionectae]|uniref:Aminotransferase n=1 Tax=Maritalea myrionectae TaxID=454601 RepID=A0A2R4MCS0_9HYPH|nr:pyridoxal phosphate-dependent aminotransferase [Maritalea myrionectae]AVX03841.1 aspartate transaminase [Maritalea myrionectae]
MEKVSAALRRIKPSASMAISQLALEKKAAGDDVIALSAGEPDFDTPEPIRNAAKRAMDEGKTRYTAASGIPELKAAIARKFARDNGIKTDPANCFVATGGKQIIYNAMMATLDEGDEAIIPAPYWVSYPEMVRLTGATPIILAADAAQGFKITPAQLDDAITDKTVWLLLNSPSNPTGAVYSADELKALAEVLRNYPHVMVLMDDIYEHLVYGDAKFATLAEVAPDLQDRIVTMNGVSKAYGMTGWRIGYCTGPSWLMAAMNKLQGQSTSNPCSIAQWASVEALEGDQSFLDKWRDAFSSRRDFVVDRLNKIEGMNCLTPDGAFYVYPSCASFIGKARADGKVIENDEDFVMGLLAEQNVASVHGGAYGLSPYFRVSYALSLPELERACDRIEAYCAGLN